MSDEKPTAQTKEQIEALIAELDSISHEAARIYALMIQRNPEAWDKFLADIKENGQTHPITFNRQGVLLAGRNRWLACKFLGLEPKVQRRDLTGVAAIEFIHSDNPCAAMMTARRWGCSRPSSWN